MKRFLQVFIISFLGLNAFSQAPVFKTNLYLERKINCVLDDDSVIWVGTTNGLVLFDTRTSKYRTVNKSPLTPFSSIVSIKKDTKGNKYLVVSNESITDESLTVIKYSKGIYTEIPLKNLDIKDFIVHSCKDKIYVTKENNYSFEVATLEGTSWVLKESAPFEGKKFQTIDKQGNVWFLDSKTKSLLKYDFEKWTDYGYDAGDYSWERMNEADFSFSHALEDKENKKVYVGGKGGFYISNDSWWISSYSLHIDFPGVYYQYIAFDKRKNPYVCTDEGFAYFNEKDSLWNAVDLNKDLKNMIFLTDNTPVFLEKQSSEYNVYDDSYTITGQIFSYRNGEIDILADEILMSETNTLIYSRGAIYTYSQDVLYQIKDKKIKEYSFDDYVPFSPNACITDGTSVLFATSEGIYRLKNNKFKKIGTSEDYHDEFLDIEKFQNEIFVSANYDEYSEVPSPYDNGGLFRLKGDTVLFDKSNDPPVVDGEELCACGDKLWMYSYSYKSLIIYKNINTEKFDSLFSINIEEPVNSITCDKKGSLYLLFDMGIVKADEVSKTDYFKDSIPELGGELKKIFCDNNGLIWVITSKGLVKFDGKKWTEFKAPEEFSGYKAPVAVDNLNRIWTVNYNHMYMFDGVKWTNMNEKLKLQEAYFSFIGYANGKVYAKCEEGIVEVSLK